MKILLVGDVMLGRLVNEVLKHEPPGYPWGDTSAIFKKADLRICNLECVISDKGQPWTITPKISLANNHVLDYEEEALLDMLETLDRNNIEYAGAGISFVEASSVAVSDKIGMIAFTDNEPEWEIGDQPGVFYVPIDLEDKRAKVLIHQIKEAKKDVDFLIVSAHWGPNWGYRPQPGHLPFAKALIDAGGDLIFGHSCHVFQGIEIYNSKPILYSTGNFIDDYAVDEVERNDQSFIFLVETEGRKIVRLKLYPTVIRNMQACLAKEPELKEIVFKMIELCDEFGTKTIWHDKDRYLEIQIR
ncbi:MAG: Poly-gamma-glutamate biosynthesis protein [Candidatus Daviesbacteria bacterium GW2011_GWA1_41_61]|nr:MAG: Poly-gamma-glutamate biosynthesis protein [Candidatus Daviesbacteria bacterium GW2011_GWA1_41_61]